ESQHLDTVLLLEVDPPQQATLAGPVSGGHDAEDQRPPETDQETKRAGEVGRHEADLPRPGNDRLDRELRQRLQAGADGEGRPLRDQELGALGRPGNQKGGENNRRKRPGVGPEAAGARCGAWRQSGQDRFGAPTNPVPHSALLRRKPRRWLADGPRSLSRGAIGSFSGGRRLLPARGLQAPTLERLAVRAEHL